jgi:hypothetical protein
MIELYAIPNSMTCWNAANPNRDVLGDFPFSRSGRAHPALGLNTELSNADYRLQLIASAIQS